MTHPGAEATAEVWRIGRHADGPSQFGTWRPDARYRVGEPLREFPSALPGPFSASTGHRPAHIRVDFAEPAVGSAAVEVRLELYANGACPAIEFELNGETRRVHPRPRRDIPHGYLVPASPFAGWATATAVFAAEHLTRGDNTLLVRTVAAVPFDADAALAAHPNAAGGAALLLTELVLVEHSGEQGPDRVDVRPLPVYLHERHGGGELVDVVVRRQRWERPLRGTLTVGESVVELELDPADRRGGEVACRIPVPAPEAESTWVLDLEVESGTETHRGVFVPCRRWTFHVVPHSHLDLGYTDHAPKALDIHARNIDRALADGAAHGGYSLSLDGAIVAQRYLRERSPAAAEEFLDAVRTGAISINALYAQFLTGTPSSSEWFRGVDFAVRLAEEHGLPLPVANITDVPVYSSALPSLLAAAGIGGFVGMTNHCRAVNDDSDELHLLSPFRWAGPDGGEVLAFFGNNYAQLADMAGRAWTLPGAVDTLSRFAELYERPDYLPDHLPILGTHSDNDDLDPWAIPFLEAWNEAFAFPRLEFGTFAGYLDAVEPWRDRLPVVRGDGGGYWEEGLGASAIDTATYRRVQTALPAAEAAAVIAGLSDERLAIDTTELDRAWERLLIAADHTWTADNVAVLPGSAQSEGQMHWQRSGLRLAEQHAIDLTRSSLSKLAENVTTRGPSLIVLNPSSWSRTIEFEAEFRRPVRLVLDGVRIPSAVIARDEGTTRVRVLVPDVPALGYAVLEIEADESTDIPDTALLVPPLLRNPHWMMGVWPAEADRVTLVEHGLEPLAGTTVETDRWSVSLGDGGVRTIRHLPTGTDLLDPESPWAFAEVFRVLGGGTEEGLGFGEELTSLWSKDLGLPAPELELQRGSTMLRGVRRVPWGTVLRLSGSGPTMPSVEVEIVLRDDDDRIDVAVTLEKEDSLAKESVYVAFPFGVGDRRLRYERQLGWVDPAVDFVSGACYEWHTAQNAVLLGSNEAVTITWVPVDAPLFTMGDIVRSEWPDRHDPAGPGIFSWVMNNWWWTNFAARQSGTFTSRYSLTVARGADLTSSARFARERRDPALVGEVTPLDKRTHGPRALPADRGVVLATQLSPGLVAHPATDLRGAGRALLRIMDTAGSGGVAEVAWAGPVWRCTALGVPIARVPDEGGLARVEVGPWGQCTVRLDAEETS